MMTDNASAEIPVDDNNNNNNKFYWKSENNYR